jgi:hypothetical protein
MSDNFPPGWTKTIDDLLAEKRNLSGEEIEWALSYEREQLLSWARFPRAGEVYELMADAEISYVTNWRAPFTGGGKGMLPGGTRVRIAPEISGPEPIGVYADPLERERVELQLSRRNGRRARRERGSVEAKEVCDPIRGVGIHVVGSCCSERSRGQLSWKD